MNILIVVTDTWRWDYLGAYGNDWIKTPYIDKLAQESVVFEGAFAEGLPTLPARRVIYTGRPIVPFQHHPQASDQVQLQGWHPLYDEDVTLSEHLRECDYVSALFNDVYHMMKPGKNFHRGFDCWYWTRGQESDPFAIRDYSQVAHILDDHTCWGNKLADRAWIIQHVMNRKEWKSDADSFVAQTLQRAGDWLREYTASNLTNPFYMHVETFEPHEPWDPPVEYARLYDPNYDSWDGLIPPGSADHMPPERLANVRHAYAGECSLADRWIGHLLDVVKETGHWDDTLIVFTSDHGCMMGEQGEVHKSANRLRNQVWQVPLVIRHPQGEHAGVRAKGFVQHTDIMPTVLSLAGQSIPERVLGRNLWPQVAGDEAGPEQIVTAFGPFAAIRNAKWSYMCPWTEVAGDPNPRRDLYDLAADPKELTNVIADHPDAVQEMSALLEAHLKKYAPLTRGSFQIPHAGPDEPTFDSLPRFDK
jgi:arylsulfatase A-like enzyme